MIRDLLSMTDLELMMKMDKSPLDREQISRYLQVEKQGVPVYIHRLNRKGLVQNISPAPNKAQYTLTTKGKGIINQLRKELE